MKTKIASYNKKLNLVSVEAALFIFRICFDFLASSLDELSAEQVEVWIKRLNSSELEKIWIRQKGMKFPSSILYFAVWHFRDRVLQEQEYAREVVEKSKIAESNSARVFEIIDPLQRELLKFSAFEGVEFVGSLIGAWMLSSPKVSILKGAGVLLPSRPKEVWIQSTFPDTLSSEKSLLLHRLRHAAEHSVPELHRDNAPDPRQQTPGLAWWESARFHLCLPKNHRDDVRQGRFAPSGSRP